MEPKIWTLIVRHGGDSPKHSPAVSLHASYDDAIAELRPLVDEVCAAGPDPDYKEPATGEDISDLLWRNGIYAYVEWLDPESHTVAETVLAENR